MEQFKRAKVVMLATNQKAHLVYLPIRVHLYWNKDKYELTVNSKPQHLYITSNDEIKEGDWCINSYDGQVWQYKPTPCPMPYWGNKSTLKKIIATTDSSLNLPKPSESFIKKFIEEYNKGNKIEDVMVKYISLPDGTEDINGIGVWENIIKVSSDNTITIRKIKDSWNKDEVDSEKEEFIYLFFSQNYDKLSGIGFTSQSISKWINQNL